ncbi:oligosaccharide flippase family protein [Vibrio parahaemolyticus]|uniref:oligosaccharide flippase family protein n=2 Tax=Vibrio harveyi group TaxID=717610 RepID=UPI001E40B3B3|nr:oligosaccharide flippase family protein [Vibrio parahaemolyticus]MDF5225870.1 oligosaccharide flippase family protein [Vibrio parahaemolyticus]
MNKNKLLRKIIDIFLKKIVVLIIGFSIVIIQAKALGAETRGVLASMLILPQLMISIAEGGMRQASVYFLGKKNYDIGKIIGTVRFFFFLSALIFSIITFYFQYQYFYNDQSFHLILISTFCFPFLMMSSFFRGVLLGFEKTREFGNNLLYPKIIQILIILFLYCFDMLDLQSSIILFTFVAVINAFQGFIAYKKVIDRKIVFKLDFSILRDMFKIGLIYALSFFFIDLNYKIGIFIAREHLELKEVGNYVLSTQLAEFVWQIPAAISIVFFSKSSNITKHDHSWSETVTKTCRIQVFISLIICLIIGYSASYFLPHVIGNDYILVGDIFMLLIPGIVFISIFKVVNVDLAGRGMPAVSLFFMPAIALTNYFLSIELIGFFGVLGLSLSVSISYILASIIIVAIYCYKFDTNFFDFILIKFNDLRVKK